MGHTAIDWLKNKLKETYNKEGKLPLAYTLHLVEQAKQIEKEQIMQSNRDGVHMCVHSYILTSEEGHRVIKCTICNNIQPI